MFLAKKIIAPMFFPVTFGLAVILIGVIFLWFSRRQRFGKILVTVGLALLGVLSNSMVADMLLRPLEYRYPPLVTPNPGIRWVVVLGGGHTSDPSLPVTSQLSSAALNRLAEGIRIHNRLPESKLILTGGCVFDPVPHARLLCDMARSLGVPQEEMILETTAKDTEEEARKVMQLIGNDPFVLVSSASHMPRAVSLFEAMGTQPIPAPVGHRVLDSAGRTPDLFFPSADALKKSQRAIYEYLGIAWAKLRGKI
jgi:uncharacterized SAM-binding protein YcdF (DUF218 family)